MQKYRRGRSHISPQCFTTGFKPNQRLKLAAAGCGRHRRLGAAQLAAGGRRNLALSFGDSSQSTGGAQPLV
jgi:hypothetical protein